MEDKKDITLLKIYLGESDSHEGHALWKYILEYLHDNKIAGVTIFRGIAGYGKSSTIHTTSILRLSTDLPIMIEVVDTIEELERVKPHILEVMQEGLITQEKVSVLYYRGNS